MLSVGLVRHAVWGAEQAQRQASRLHSQWRARGFGGGWRDAMPRGRAGGNPFLSGEGRLLILRILLLRTASGYKGTVLGAPSGPSPRGGASPLRRGGLCATCPPG